MNFACNREKKKKNKKLNQNKKKPTKPTNNKEINYCTPKASLPSHLQNNNKTLKHPTIFFVFILYFIIQCWDLKITDWKTHLKTVEAHYNEGLASIIVVFGKHLTVVRTPPFPSVPWKVPPFKRESQPLSPFLQVFLLRSLSPSLSPCMKGWIEKTFNYFHSNRLNPPYSRSKWW